MCRAPTRRSFERWAGHSERDAAFRMRLRALLLLSFAAVSVGNARAAPSTPQSVIASTAHGILALRVTDLRASFGRTTDEFAGCARKIWNEPTPRVTFDDLEAAAGVFRLHVEAPFVTLLIAQYSRLAALGVRGAHIYASAAHALMVIRRANLCSEYRFWRAHRFSWACRPAALAQDDVISTLDSSFSLALRTPAAYLSLTRVEELDQRAARHLYWVDCHVADDLLAWSGLGYPALAVPVNPIPPGDGGLPIVPLGSA